jgi:LysM repeat protein
MRELRVLILLATAGLFAGCGYIHFGRLPRAGDPALESAYLDLSLQQKILKQELVIAHKENETLRNALERGSAPATDGKADVTRQLEATTQELATLRASYAKLQGERANSIVAANGASDTALAAARDKLASLSSDEARLREENARLKNELDAARTENATLASQLKTSLSDKEQAESAARQLNSELLAAKEARAQAEQASASLRAQLDAVVARATRADAAPASTAPSATSTVTPTTEAKPASTPTAAPSALADLQSARTPPSGAVPMVELHTSLNRARTASAPASAPPTPPAESPLPPVPSTEPAVAATATSTPAEGTASTVTETKPTPAVPPAAPAVRTYTVQPGDTLEKIATKFYGAANEWGKIYAANSEALSATSGIKPGMELKIPEK